MPEENKIMTSMTVSDHGFEFLASIASAMEAADAEMLELHETIETVTRLKPECDKLDYALACCSGALCGVMDIFLVGKPGETPLGDRTDKWFAERTMDFARLCGWKDPEGGLSSAIRHLECRFKIPYDQTGLGDAAKEVFDLSPNNHHFKSLGHNPTLLGLFFSILDQWRNSSHFVTGGELISLQKADPGFELRGGSVPAKLFCGFVNWFGHLVSDVSGASGSKGRGMGIPSPFWAWINDLTVIRNKLRLPEDEFVASLNDLAINVFKQGFDVRFQTAQAVPVLINELTVRLIYAVRRSIGYITSTEKAERCFRDMWRACEPFSNPTVKRMLTVAHGTFCLVDAGDAVARGFAAGAGTFNAEEFVMRLNIIGVGRFAISLWGEGKRGIETHRARQDAELARRRQVIVEDYLCGLKALADMYDDSELLTFVQDFERSGAYKEAFLKTVKLAEKRGVPEESILKTKGDIDRYFIGGESKNETE